MLEVIKAVEKILMRRGIDGIRATEAGFKLSKLTEKDILQNLKKVVGKFTEADKMDLYKMHIAIVAENNTVHYAPNVNAQAHMRENQRLFNEYVNQVNHEMFMNSHSL